MQSFRGAFQPMNVLLHACFFFLVAVLLIPIAFSGCKAKGNPAVEARTAMNWLLLAAQKGDAAAAARYLDGTAIAEASMRYVMDTARNKGKSLPPAELARLRSTLASAPQEPLFRKSSRQLTLMRKMLTICPDPVDSGKMIARAETGAETMIFQLEKKGLDWMVTAFWVDQP